MKRKVEKMQEVFKRIIERLEAEQEEDHGQQA